ncbi:2Fe-2S iron-sulfur cluster binding domain-containing protein [Novosphingobium sp. G106]|uniref:2Fe-2S iron-sulfur cluster-binding protein n=1 Tax=Novosphingobium sp. G106 TaxID=2849500 RepID=UPI001C2DB5CE|nr:2Fe-2S iron-sulfur cluster-binding protein [Novosphingobium sp. G106]MBV1691583.1 2Fe-2S iron-sulfur cluster binding domain-containing protein [Novosphingobium sp. G106]
MVAITFISADGSERTIEAEEGLSLMENAVGNGIDAIEAICGGNAYCGTCRVYVDPAWQAIMGEAAEIELPMIEVSGDETPGVRLSCQITVAGEHDGLIVRTPASQGAS